MEPESDNNIESVTDKFSDELPEGCPPSSAENGVRDIFIVSQNNPVTSDDCRTQADKKRALKATGAAACKRHGLSVFPSLESCSHHQKLYPYLGMYLAKATLSANDGVVAATPTHPAPLHLTWWPYVKVVRHVLFQVIWTVES